VFFAVRDGRPVIEKMSSTSGRSSDRRGRYLAEGKLLAALGPTAQRIIIAAQRILSRDGFAGLSVEAIAKEAGTYKDAMRYHFGSKEGLITTLVDASTHDASLRVYAEVRRKTMLEERVKTLVEASRDQPDTEGYRTIWELLPHIIRNEELRERVAWLYDIYRSHYEEVFEVTDDPAGRRLVRSYASLMLAVLDGLAMQKALDPNGVDLDAIFSLWAQMASQSVRELQAGGVE
jgi:AcrR family transcriptional regulator